MIKAVIFDLDNTLYDFHRFDLIALKNLVRYADKAFGLDEEKFLAIYAESRRIVKNRLFEGAASHNRVLFFQTALELMGKNSFESVLDMYDAYWNEFLDKMKLYDGALEFLQWLKARGIKTALCTDMTAHIQFRKVKRFGLERLLDAMVTCEEVGVEKPSPQMFQMSLEKLGVQPSEAVMIGDSLERDVEGAAKAGLLPIWFTADRAVNDAGVDYMRVTSYRDERLKALVGEKVCE